MKTLYLLRHVDTEKTSTKGDFKRTITPFGISQTALLAKYINKNNIMPDLILCSDAIRTKQTLELINKVCNFKSNILYLNELYNAQTNVLENQVLMADNSVNSLMLIGHNPAITMLPLRFKLAKIISKLSDFNHTGKLVGICFNNATWSNLLIAPCKVTDLFCP